MDGWIGYHKCQERFFWVDGCCSSIRRCVWRLPHSFFYFQTFVCLFGIYYLDESAVRDCNAMTRDEQIFVWIFAPKDPNQILYVRLVSAAVMNCLIGTKL